MSLFLLFNLRNLLYLIKVYHELVIISMKIRFQLYRNKTRATRSLITQVALD